MPFLFLVLAAIFSGTASALFLSVLDVITVARLHKPELIWLLPVFGLLVHFLYSRWGKNGAQAGNALWYSQLHTNSQERSIPFSVSWLVLLGTWLTHLGGGSAGREGTAVQMGASLNDTLGRFWSKYLGTTRLPPRATLLRCGLASGFAAVFGTPMAGFLFALEVGPERKMPNAVTALSALVSAWVGHYTCLAWGITHTTYGISEYFNGDSSTPSVAWLIMGTVTLGLTSGIVAQFFVQSGKYFKNIFARIPKPWLRPVIGGIIVALLLQIPGFQHHAGLGVDTIVDAFHKPLAPWDFAIKSIMTTLTLGSGFKGGEVTPLFFVGATLGNALHNVVALPLDLLVSLGFVSVFAGATKTPLACAIMGVELFLNGHGALGTGVIAIAILASCLLASLSSGKDSIYT